MSNSFSANYNSILFASPPEVRAKVYNVVLPEQTLYITNHFWDVNAIAKKGEEVKAFSERYWELYTKFVHIMRDHGNNVFQVSTSGIKSTVSGDRYTFDFTEFDRGVELVIKEGGAKRIECLYPYLPAELRSKAWTDNDTILNYWSQYYPAFYDHLKSKGWKDMYMEHIWDEVPDSKVPEYIRRAENNKEIHARYKNYRRHIYKKDSRFNRRLGTPVSRFMRKFGVL